MTAKVISLRGPSIDGLIGEISEANDNNALMALLMVGLDGEGRPVVGASQMTAERALWLADHLLQYVRTL